MVAHRLALSLVALGVLALAGPAEAQTRNLFDKRGELRLIIGVAPGGEYDLAARLIARHIGRHLPGNPSIVPENMPGAMSLNAANYLYNIAPRDGSVFGTFSRNLPNLAVLGEGNIRFDPRRFGWIGAAGQLTHVCVARSTSSIASAEDLFHRELLIGGSGAGGGPTMIPKMLNQLIGTRFHIVDGYPSMSAAVLALRQGEVEGLCHSYAFFKNIHADLIQQNVVRVLLRTEDDVLPGIPEVPSAVQYTRSDEARELLRFVTSNVEFGRPFVLPPDVPPERLAVLRRAFAETLADPALIAEADHLKLDMTHRSGEALASLLDQLYATPPAVLARAAPLMPTAD